jgi:hypothetical protein
MGISSPNWQEFWRGKKKIVNEATERRQGMSTILGT